MARKAAAAAETPLSESARLAEERRKLGLAQARAQKQAQPCFFGDIGVALVPPDPAVEEPPRDEPSSAAEEVSDADLAEALAADAAARMAEAASEPSAEDAIALEDYAGALEEDDRPGRAVIDLDVAPTGPDSFGGEDGLPAPSAETLRQQIIEDRELLQTTNFGNQHLDMITDGSALAALAALEPSLTVAEAAEASTIDAATLIREEAAILGASAVLPEDVPFEVLPISDKEKEFIEQRSMADVEIQQAAAVPGFSLFGENLFGDAIKPKSSGPLAERFTLPPFSVLDARQGVWQDRKRAWIALGIQSEVGRGANLIGRSPQELFAHMTGIPYAQAREIVTAAIAERGDAFDLEALIDEHGRRGVTAVSQRLAPGGGGGGCWLGGPATASTKKFVPHTASGVGPMALAGGFGGQSTATSGTSIFDPVLTELIYRWFCPADGVVFDPFAGGSVRGIVASKLGLKYVGVELRPEQILANEAQAETICAGDSLPPSWLEGDAQDLKALTDGFGFDLVMACPPYADLEQYSEDPRDLSNMTYEAFSEAYTKIIQNCVDVLKNDRFACYVVGDVRCPDGFYRGLPELTVKAFEAAGARKYNEAILVTSVGSLPIRVGKQFNAGRKLGKTHQNCYVFVKGDPKRAAEACNGQMELPS